MNIKKFFLSSALTVCCLGFAAVGFAEAKAFEQAAVLKGTYAHTMRNEFFIRNANMYNSFNPFNSWGEIIAHEESGFDGSVTRNWLIGDLKRDKANNYVLIVKRHVIQKADNRGNVIMHKVENVNYTINAYHRMESGVKLAWSNKGQKPCTDVDGEYVSSLEYPVMSSEAAMYILERFMNSTPGYKNKLEGLAMEHVGNKLAETHIIKLLEHHSDHVVTRGTYNIIADGTILEYSVANDSWREVTP